MTRSLIFSSAHWKALVEQLDKYQDKLFADPITVPTAHGTLLIQPQRTNNLMERFFRDWRRGARRRTGHNSIGRFLQTMIADTPLVRNLQNPRYLQILLHGQATLEDRFAQIDIQTVRKELQAAQVSLRAFTAQRDTLTTASVRDRLKAVKKALGADTLNVVATNQALKQAMSRIILDPEKARLEVYWHHSPASVQVINFYTRHMRWDEGSHELSDHGPPADAKES